MDGRTYDVRPVQGGYRLHCSQCGPFGDVLDRRSAGWLARAGHEKGHLEPDIAKVGRAIKAEGKAWVPSGMIIFRTGIPTHRCLALLGFMVKQGMLERRALYNGTALTSHVHHLGKWEYKEAEKDGGDKA